MMTSLIPIHGAVVRKVICSDRTFTPQTELRWMGCNPSITHKHSTMSKLSLDVTAINMDGNGSFSSTYHIDGPDDLKGAMENFDATCPFRKYDTEVYAYKDNDEDLTEEERQWFLDQEVPGFDQ